MIAGGCQTKPLKFQHCIRSIEFELNLVNAANSSIPPTVSPLLLNKCTIRAKLGPGGYDSSYCRIWCFGAIGQAAILAG